MAKRWIARAEEVRPPVQKTAKRESPHSKQDRTGLRRWRVELPAKRNSLSRGKWIAGKAGRSVQKDWPPAKGGCLRQRGLIFGEAKRNYVKMTPGKADGLQSRVFERSTKQRPRQRGPRKAGKADGATDGQKGYLDGISWAILLTK